MLPTPMVNSPRTVAVSTTADDDAALVKKAQKNPSAFQELYRRHVIRVYRYLVVRLGNSQEAQAVTSATFLTALERIGRYRGEATFAAWLLDIARHQAAEQMRQRPYAVAAAGDKGNHLDGQTMAVETVGCKLQGLSADRAEALSLRLFGDLEMSDIARLLHKSESTVRFLVHQGLLDLQGQLRPSQEKGI